MNKPTSIRIPVICLFFACLQLAPANDLERLRNLREAQVKEIDRKYVNALRQLKADFLRAGNLERANEIETEIQKYSPPKTTGLDEHAQVNVTGEFHEFKEGESMFENRGYKWVDVPRRFSKWEIHFRGGGAVARLDLEVTSPGVVHIVIEDRDLDSYTKNGWEKVDSCKGSNKNELFILKKRLDAGKHTLHSTGFLSTRLLRPPNDTK